MSSVWIGGGAAGGVAATAVVARTARESIRAGGGGGTGPAGVEAEIVLAGTYGEIVWRPR